MVGSSKWPTQPTGLGVGQPMGDPTQRVPIPTKPIRHLWFVSFAFSIFFLLHFYFRRYSGESSQISAEAHIHLGFFLAYVSPTYEKKLELKSLFAAREIPSSEKNIGQTVSYETFIS
jgi:hypothetical protein